MDDTQIRMAAFSELKRRVQMHGACLPWIEIIRTFRIGEEEIYLTNRARGIFKPKQMQRGVLSVKSTLPRTGRDRRYIDDRRGDNLLLYSLQGTDPTSHDNQRLKEAFEDQSPFIYFHGVSAGRYEVLWPTYVSSWIPEKLKVEIQIGSSTLIDAQNVVKDDERKYYTRLAKQRIHQAAFREIVLQAYGERCSLSGLPVRTLLEAAHIYPDGHEMGFARVTNGIAMSTLHHVAYDSGLIGINPDGKILVSERIMSQQDGPLLEKGFKELNNCSMRFPTDSSLSPDKEALAFRFEEFLKAV